MKRKVIDEYLLTVAFDEACKSLSDVGCIKISKRLKRKINRIFREELGAIEPKYPEVDNKYEYMRSRFIIKIKRKYGIK